MHAEAVRRHDFDSVLTPVNYHLYTADAEFRANFDILYELLEERDVALRTIKATARKPWVGDHKLATWYEPFTTPEDIRAAMSWVLGSFPYIAGLATAGETTLLGQGDRCGGQPHGRRGGRCPPCPDRRLPDDLRLVAADDLMDETESGLPALGAGAAAGSRCRS